MKQANEQLEQQLQVTSNYCDSIKPMHSALLLVYPVAYGTEGLRCA
jgi:hypothetical protein